VGWICTLVLTYHPTRYHEKIVEFFFGGGVLHNIQQAYSRAGVRVVIALPFGIFVDDTIMS